MALEKDRNGKTQKTAQTQGKSRDGDLEQYGVWVKADPQDISDEIELPEAIDFGEEAPNLSGGNSTEEAFLTEEEENLLGSLESFDALPEDEPNSPLTSSADFSLDIEVDEFTIEDYSDTGSKPKSADKSPAPPPSESMDFDEFSVEEFTGSKGEEPVEAFPESEKRASPQIDEFSVEDFMDEVPSAMDTPSEIEASIDEAPLEIDLEFDDSLPESIPDTQDVLGSFHESPASSKKEKSSGERTYEPLSATDLTEVDVDEIVNLNANDRIPEMDLESSGLNIVNFEADNGNGPSEDLDLTASGMVESEGSDMPELVDSASISLDSFDMTEPSEIEEISLSGSISKKIPQAKPSIADMDFDDVGDLERSLQEGDQEVTGNNKADSDSVSAQLLQKIASDLNSIKEEISSLKEQLNSIKRGGSQAVATEVSEEDDAAGKGFFDDEEDETIALTGDELDNILNTADFTEEAGQDSSLDMDEVGFGGDSSSDDSKLIDSSNIVSEGSDLSFETISGDTVQGEEVFAGTDLENVGDTILPMDDPVINSFEVGSDDGSEIALLHEIDVKPMTEAPEDTSYLEEPLEVSELQEPDFGDITLTERPLEEPKLEELQLDEEIEESTEELPVVFDEEPPVKSRKPAPSPQATKPAVSPIEDILIDEPSARASQGNAASQGKTKQILPDTLKSDIKSVLSYMDKLLESLPEEKIEEFAKSDHFQVYKKLFEELGLI